MTPTDAWPKVAVVGTGAVGGYFGGMLARAGAPVAMAVHHSDIAGAALHRTDGGERMDRGAGR